MITRSMLDQLSGEPPDTYSRWISILIPADFDGDAVLYASLGISALLIVIVTALAGGFIFLRGRAIAAAAAAGPKRRG